MTEEEWKTLEAISPLLESWEKNKFFRSRSAAEQKPRIDWLVSQFGWEPTCWACAGSIRSKLSRLYKVYERAKQQRDTEG